MSDDLLYHAKENDQQALETIFRQYIPQHEQIIDSQYLGVLGRWGVGTYCFAAVTTQRIASIRLSLLGHVHYQDGILECINSSTLVRPSRLGLFLYTTATSLAFGSLGFFIGFLSGSSTLASGALGAVLAILLSVLALPLTVPLYHRFKKSGLVFKVKDGNSVSIFIDPKLMNNAKRFYRICCDQHKERVRTVRQSETRR